MRCKLGARLGAAVRALVGLTHTSWSRRGGHRRARSEGLVGAQGTGQGSPRKEDGLGRGHTGGRAVPGGGCPARLRGQRSSSSQTRNQEPVGPCSPGDADLRGRFLSQLSSVAPDLQDVELGLSSL